MAKEKTDIKKDNPEKLKGNETPNLWLNLRWPNKVQRNKKKYTRKQKHKKGDDE